MVDDSGSKSADPAGDDLWKAPAAPKPRKGEPANPALPPPTGPRYEFPVHAEGHSDGRRVLIIVGCVVLALVGIGFAFAKLVFPVFDAQREKEADTYAKMDVSTLGRDIATYYVDYDGPPPEITVVNGRYHLDAGSNYLEYNDEIVSPGVRFGGITGTGFLDWCVWVTNSDGKYKDFEYSAQRGLQQGRC